MEYVIVPKRRVIYATIEASDAENAMADFAASMDTDMNNYFMAIPEDQYEEYCHKEDGEAHKRFITTWMRQVVLDEYPVYDGDIASEIADRAYEIYCEGNGDTEYECVEKAYDERYAALVTVSNIQWDWNREDVDSLLGHYNTAEMVRMFKLDDEDVDNCEIHEGAILDLCYDSLKQNRVTPEEIFNLPEMVEVPGTFNDEQITEYLAEEYGYCVGGYTLSDDQNEEADNAD